MEAVRHAPYELAVGLPGGGFNLLHGRIRVAIGDVRRNRAREQDWVLRERDGQNQLKECESGIVST